MARLKPSIIKIRGTILNTTTVDSKRYGEHARAARGTYTPITLNDELKKSSERLADCNKPAKLIFDAVRDEHKDGGLWPDILSIFRKQIKEGKSFSLEGFDQLECSKDYRLHTLLHGLFRVDVKTSKKKMHVTVSLQQHPIWEKKKYLDGYQLSITVVFPDFEQEQFTKETARSPIIGFKDEIKPLKFSIPVPEFPTPYAIFMGVTGCTGKEIWSSAHLKGMAVVKVKV
jgi:hypothetical protein